MRRIDTCRRAVAARSVLALAILAIGAGTASAQQRPLVTEDPETIGAGRILIEGGIDLEHESEFPVSGLVGNRLSVPTLGISVGLSSIAELQIDGGLYQRLAITERDPHAPLASLTTFTGDHTHDVEDIVLATKIRIVSETPQRPAFGLRFATKLPNADNKSGLGTNMTDFFASLLVGKTVQSIRIVGNAGLGILGDPNSPIPKQDDVLTLGASIARALTTSAEVVAEVSSRLNFENGDPPPGMENRGVMRLGARYTHKSVRFDGGVVFGMTSRDPQVGVTAGFTWVLDAFHVP